MKRALVITVHFHEGRYHGSDNWPPDPARLFQALVAGSANGSKLPVEDVAALEWLQEIEAPIILAPTVRKGNFYKIYVPNNDLDAKGGNPGRIAEIRTAVKTIRPFIFDTSVPLLYVWQFYGCTVDTDNARTICQIAGRLYQLGRGVDMAWALGEILNTDELESRLACHNGVIYRPTKGATGTALLCPAEGSFASLRERYDATRKRFTVIPKGRTVKHVLSQPPKPRFAKVMYDAPPCYFLFDMRTVGDKEAFFTWSPMKTVELVEYIRDQVVSRLKNSLPKEVGKIDQVLIGREATEVDKAIRVRIVPLSSIGHEHADHAIRRVLIVVPPNCLLRPDDITWAFSSLEYLTGEILWNLVRSEEQEMLHHYGIGDGEQNIFRVWRTITPAALPIPHPGRKNDRPRHIATEEKASHAVKQALRHVGITTPVEAVRVQREPFDRNGSRAEEFVVPERFTRHALHHVEVSFTQPVRGPLIIGNGRYLGLGLMAPKKVVSSDVLFFSIKSEKNIATTDATLLLHAVRRALMSLSKDDTGHVHRLFSGHESEGSPARSGRHEHVFLATDDTNENGYLDRLIVAAPWACDHTTKGNHEQRVSFDKVVRKLTYVRAGRLGAFNLGPACALATGDPLVGPARVWESRTEYRPTRHAERRKDMRTAVLHDIFAECERRGIPKPEIEILELGAGPNGGNIASRLRLHFKVAVEGPLMLGQDSHSGGGLFSATSE